jgi:porphobilinogen synthase
MNRILNRIEAKEPPDFRFRRLRKTQAIRDMVRENHLHAHEFVMPVFIKEGTGVRNPIESMPGVEQWSIDIMLLELKKLVKLGLRSVLLFGIPPLKDANGSYACLPEGIIPKAIHEIRKKLPSVYVITDVCFCEYTDHGHCGVVHEHAKGEYVVDNDATLQLLAEQAVVHAKAGAHMVAPSGMMDGMVQAIRKGLDAQGYGDVAIMSYAAKFCSAFYGPFRDVAESAPQFGDRRGYQMDAANGREALREIGQDLAEGADIIMIKPGMSYLDIVARARDAYAVPLAVYNVSGEYSMIKAACSNGWLQEKPVVLESLLSMKRAGAEIIISYWTPKVLEWLVQEK